jgi:hypothetical protein
MPGLFSVVIINHIAVRVWATAPYSLTAFRLFPLRLMSKKIILRQLLIGDRYLITQSAISAAARKRQ